MSAHSLTAREKEILGILEVLYPYKDNFTLIGGYAVDAYALLPRFSVDCDIVISKMNLAKFTKIFKENGFADKGAIYHNKLDGIGTRKFIKLVENNPVSIDLLIDGVKCRQTEAVWTQKEISENSKDQRVIGVTASVLSKVASREHLIAMKLHSGRNTDLKDVAMLANDLDWDALVAAAKRGSREKLASQLESEIKTMKGVKFENELKSYFGTKERQEKRIEFVLGGVKKLLIMLK